MQQVRSDHAGLDNADTGVGAEIAGIHGYYGALIAAARSTLSPRDAAAVVRNLTSQKIAAVREAKNRRKALRAANRARARMIVSKPA
jgi:hypothetical protein